MNTKCLVLTAPSLGGVCAFPTLFLNSFDRASYRAIALNHRIYVSFGPFKPYTYATLLTFWRALSAVATVITLI